MRKSTTQSKLKMKLVFPNGQEIKYTVPTMKYWEYSDIDIMQDKMYPLKKKHGEGSSELRETIMEAKKRQNNRFEF